MTLVRPIRAPRQDASDVYGVSEICLLLAAEVEIARAMGLRLETSLCVLTAKLGLDAERVRDLQELDLILQHLAAVRDLLAMTSEQIDPSLRISLAEALGRITLADVRARISCSVFADAPSAQSGEFEQW